MNDCLKDSFVFLLPLCPLTHVSALYHFFPEHHALAYRADANECTAQTRQEIRPLPHSTTQKPALISSGVQLVTTPIRLQPGAAFCQASSFLMSYFQSGPGLVRVWLSYVYFGMQFLSPVRFVLTKFRPCVHFCFFLCSESL